jgi:hypothetical protein
MALCENNSQLRYIVAQGTFTLNGTTAVAIAVPAVELTSVIVLSFGATNLISPTATATAPYISALTPGTGFSVKCGTASANDNYIYVVWNQ